MIVPECSTGSLVEALKFYGVSSPRLTPSALTNSPANGVHIPRIVIQDAAFSCRASDSTWSRVFQGEVGVATDPPPRHTRSAL